MTRTTWWMPWSTERSHTRRRRLLERDEAAREVRAEEVVVTLEGVVVVGLCPASGVEQTTRIPRTSKRQHQKKPDDIGKVEVLISHDNNDVFLGERKGQWTSFLVGVFQSQKRKKGEP